jgi:carbon storage regulator
MLVVTRRPGESVVIELPTGERIEVVVLGIKGNQVRLGTDAPKHMPVVREELLERLDAGRVAYRGVLDRRFS